MIKIYNLNTGIGSFKLTNINLEISKGEYFVLLGPTGSGKTILMESLLGIRKIDEGSIIKDGRDITSLPIEMRKIGYMPQDYALFPHMNVFNNIAYGLNIKKVSKKEQDKKVRELAKSLQIEDILHRSINGLSGGEKQRVALGRAIACGLDIIFLDEPLGALDENTRNLLCEELRKIHDSFNLTFIHICHNFEEAVNVADRIAIMNNGTIEQVGTVREIFDTPQSMFVAEFIRTENILEGIASVVDKTSIVSVTDTVKIHIKSTFSGSVIISFRPEKVEIGGCMSKNVFNGRIVSVKDRGNYSSLKIDIGIPVTLHTLDQSLIEGSDISIHIPPDSINVIPKKV